MGRTDRHQRGALHIGLLAEDMAERAGDVPVWLDRPLSVAPEAGTKLTYGQLGEAIIEVAARLHAAGIQRGDEVVVYKTYNADVMVIACALGRLGAVPILLSPVLGVETVLPMIARLGGPRLLTDEQTLSTGVGEAQLAEGQPPLTIEELSTFAGASRPSPVLLDPEAPALVTHTSGTTGLPKMCAQSARSLQGQVPPPALLFQLLRFREPMAMCVSLVHARMYPGLAIMANRKIPGVFLTDPDPGSVARILTEVKPGGLEAHPNIFVRWEELCDHEDEPLSNVRIFINGFDAAHPRTIRRMLAASKRRLPVYAQGYGQTEIGLVTGKMYTRRSAARMNGRCVGRKFFPNLTGMRVRPPDGRRRASASAPGAIEGRSRGLALTYIAQEDVFAAKEQGKWWQMEDMGYRTRWGCLHLLDREIDRGTGLESNLAVEDKLMERLDQLTEAVLVPGDGELPVPVVCTLGDLPLDLPAWKQATGDLPPMSAPLHCRWEDMPVTATWKVRRPELTRMVREGELTQSMDRAR